MDNTNYELNLSAPKLDSKFTPACKNLGTLQNSRLVRLYLYNRFRYIVASNDLVELCIIAY